MILKSIIIIPEAPQTFKLILYIVFVIITEFVQLYVMVIIVRINLTSWVQIQGEVVFICF